MKNILILPNRVLAAGACASVIMFLFLWNFSGGMFAKFFPALQYNAADVAPAHIAPVLPPPPRHISTPTPVRALYMTSWVAGTPSLREQLVDFIKISEINAIVIDIKDYTGKVSFLTDNLAIQEMGSEEKRIADMGEFIQTLHKHGIYVIGRISVFQDPHVVSRKQEIAVHKKDGSVWKDRKGITWVDPASEVMWEYIVEIGRVSERMGFDELNFDYVRFPSDGNMENISYPVWDGKKSRSDVLENFFAYLDIHLHNVGVPISFDLFGMTMTNTDDLNIGQVLEKAVPYADYIAPMVYPSHYPSGWNNISNPAASPYEVINYVMKEGAQRLEVMRLSATSTSSPLYGKEFAKLRPWIQDFDLGATYTADMIKKEKQAVYDAGLDSWMVWDPKNIYTREAYTE